MERFTNISTSVFANSHMQMIMSFSFFWIVFYFSIYMFWTLHTKFKIECLANHATRKKMSIRITSSIHAVLVTILAILVLLFDEELNQNRLLYQTPEISLTLNIVIGYMCYDLITMLAYKELYEFESIIHHVVSATAFYACTHYGVFTYIALLRLTSEASTLLINIRWILLTLKMKYSKLYYFNGMAIIAVFGLFRVLTIVPIWYEFYLSSLNVKFDQVSLLFKVICVITSVPLDVLNVYWYYLIINGMLRYFKVDVNNNHTHTANKTK